MGALRRLGLILAIVTAAMPAAAQQGPQPGWGYGPWDGWGWMMMGPLTMIIVLAAIVIIVVLAVRWVSGSGHSQAQPPGRSEKTPLDILKERFARGEIDQQEFEERKRVLDS